jgi:hypothetical protein
MDEIYFTLYGKAQYDVCVGEEDYLFGGKDQFCERFGPDCECCQETNTENLISAIINANDRLESKMSMLDISRQLYEINEKYINDMLFESFELGHF